ncbi:Tuberous sclerosis 2 [Neolecta irregularis DAH-3]|uniref:Tuberous sclerosis 2 n=1 Tax=Neolecta irregularis (strain DAH-3) TaxID=1198029 RepID=A0A1U7LUS1_NEOID|nr:Tuberous sclerosis 2 [Neolecta irregularis DAH-3]|eukprot:OLL26292.1 Tuberous sclerosis 2 [Neolecta irregularis DAH-3]
MLDLLEWFCFTDVELRSANPDTYVAESLTKTWIYGNSLITVTSHGPSSSFDVVIRRPATTGRYTFKSVIKPGLALSSSSSAGNNTLSNVHAVSQPMLPGFFIMQLMSRPNMLPNAKPMPLPDDDNTRRSISVFDRIPVVNFHKMGVLYVGKGQTTEQQILSNRVGSCEYMEFLSGLGNLVLLKDNKDIYTGGLDTEDNHDGAFAYFWSDKITQIIYHTCTLMPTDLEHDPQCTMKKRHIGNSFVNIIYNDSGIPYHFDTIPGQFNFVNIIITPTSASRTYKMEQESISFKVELQCQPELPETSPIYEFKMIHTPALPNFVRNIALNADIFAQAYHKEEYVTNWRERLIKINGIRERILSLNAPTPASPVPPMSKTSPKRKPSGDSVTLSDRETEEGAGMMRFEQFFDLSHLL